MFAPETYRPTYQGPFLATGETLRRARNDAQASGDSQSIARGYVKPMRGIQAGSPMSSLRASLMADAQGQQATSEGMTAYNQLAQQNSQNNLAFQVARAKELSGLASLLLGKQETDYMADAAQKDRDSSERVFKRQMQVNREIQRRQEEAAKRKVFMNAATGILTGLGFGVNPAFLAGAMALQANNRG